MKSRLSQKNTVRSKLRLSLQMKLAIGIGIFVIIAGVIIFIMLNTGTSKQTKAGGTTGPSSNNAYFDATNGSYIDFGRGKALDCISDLPNGKTMTITMWVRWTNLTAPGVGQWANFFTLNDSTGNGDNGVFWVQHNQTNTKFEFAINTVSSGRQVIQSTTTPVVGTWYHLACVFNGNGGTKQMMIYVNGVLEAYNAAATGKIAPFSNLAKLSMGRWSNPQDNYRHFNGNIDEVSIWNIAFTQTQVTNIMNNPTTVTGTSYNAAGLLGYWNFDNKTAKDLTNCDVDGKIGSGVTLPVELISFTAKKNDNTADLKWITASETNNDHFSVEKSTDGETYESIGTVKGAGNSNSPVNYSFKDENAGTQINYYRLKQVDYDGASHYSKVAVVNMAMGSGDIGTITAGPSPFTDRLNVNYNAADAGQIEVILYDMTGKVMKKKAADVEKGTNTILLDDISNLPSGYYLAGVTQNKVSTKLIKLVKAN